MTDIVDDDDDEFFRRTAATRRRLRKLRNSSLAFAVFFAVLHWFNIPGTDYSFWILAAGYSFCLGVEYVLWGDD